MRFSILLPSLAVLFMVNAEAYAAKKADPAPPTIEQKMLSHVEKVLVVDSLTVDKYEFFRNYRLQPSSGAIISGAEVERSLGKTRFSPDFVGSPFTGFTNEFRDYMVWAQQDTTGYLRLAESVRLADGSWSAPEFTPAVLNFGREVDEDDEEEINANAAFPFMLDDGQTLYYAADNGQSLGGYDIFIATKDPSDGEFLIPGNLGMPFNSPYDDYMMALDRQTGVGWWASDRNQLGDEITIYIFALSDERVNVEPDDEDLMAYATLSGWESLLDDAQQAERKRLLNAISSIKPSDPRTPEFYLPMPGGSAYSFLSDFKNRQAASRMQLYLAQKKALGEKEAQLAALRADYAKGNRSVASRIRSLEEEVRKSSEALSSMLSEIYRLETNL